MLGEFTHDEVMECGFVQGQWGGVFGMAYQCSSRIRLHLGAMGRSHSGVDLIPRLSSAQCSGSVEDKRARKYVRATRSGCVRGVRCVGIAHCHSLSSRK